MSRHYKRQIAPKKALGQHFLKDDEISQQIAKILNDNGLPILEIGPGTGAMTTHLFEEYGERLHLIEVDTRSVRVLKENYPSIAHQIYEADFLQLNIAERFPNGVNVIGNFPYNISSQILFKVLDNAAFVPQFGGMFQKEVAQRVAATVGGKDYGQMTILREMFYDAEYLFDVGRDAFDPPPKVVSGVLRMQYTPKDIQGADINKLKKMIKTAFLQRRKKMRNSLKGYFSAEQLAHEIFDLRPEQLDLAKFLELYKMWQE